MATIVTRAGKGSPLTHAEVDANFTNLNDELGGKAPLASPALTGTPTAPTAAVGTDTTQLATTAFVNAEIANDAPTKTGGGASGTWAINISGNAATVTTAPAPTTAQVGSATAGLAVGSVGSYIFASCSGLISPGDTRAGSNISPAGIFTSANFPQGAPASSGSTCSGADTGSAPYGGTWRCMGSSLNYTAFPARARMTLFLRIS